MKTSHHKNLSLWSRIFPFLGLFGGFAFAFCQYLIYVYAPTEASLGLSQKLFYYHLPLAWWGLFSFFVVFLAGIAYLKTRSLAWDCLGLAAASTGLILACLALLSGMFWGRMAWGIWWTWDARLTTTLIMCFVYAAYMILRQMDMPAPRKAAMAAVVGIVAFLDVPLVFFSARLWSYIHPPSIELDPQMKLTLVVCLLSFGFLWIAMVSLGFYLAKSSLRIQSMVSNRLLQN